MPANWSMPPTATAPGRGQRADAARTRARRASSACCPPPRAAPLARAAPAGRAAAGVSPPIVGRPARRLLPCSRPAGARHRTRTHQRWSSGTAGSSDYQSPHGRPILVLMRVRVRRGYAPMAPSSPVPPLGGARRSGSCEAAGGELPTNPVHLRISSTSSSFHSASSSSTAAVVSSRCHVRRPAVRPSSSGSPRVVSRSSSPAIARASAACAAHSAAERLNGQATRPVGECTSRPAVECKNARGILFHSPRGRGRHARFSRSVSPCASTNSKPRPASTAGRWSRRVVVLRPFGDG